MRFFFSNYSKFIFDFREQFFDLIYNLKFFLKKFEIELEEFFKLCYI